MTKFDAIISRSDFDECEIDIGDFQGGYILLSKNKKIVAEYYQCEWCGDFFEIDNKYEKNDHIFCSTDCYAEYITELTYEDQFYYDV